MGTVRWWFWVESALAFACGVLAAATLVWRAWFETLTGLDPDRYSGWVEWLVVAGLATCSVVVSFRARREWRRAVTALSTSA